MSSLRDLRGAGGLGPGTEVPGYRMSSLRDWCDIFRDLPSLRVCGMPEGLFDPGVLNPRN
jgi:hypothetical protein